MGEPPRSDDHEFTATVDNRVRRRLGFEPEHGEVVRFVVQLEYRHDGTCHEVVRYDHDGAGRDAFAHDVAEEGLHIDNF